MEDSAEKSSNSSVGIEESTMLRRGSYGKVVLVATPHEVLAPSGMGLGSRIRGWLGGNRPEVARQVLRHEAIELSKIVMDVLDHGQISEVAIRSLPTGSTEAERIKLASVLAFLNKMYTKKKFDTDRASGVQQPYVLGLILSDFLEVIPPTQAASILLASSNPDIARRITSGEGDLKGLQTNDTQQLSVEGVVLLPQNKRSELFEEMHRLQPGNDGGAYRFFAFLASKWTDRMSNYCGQRFIELNLPQEQAETKTREVSADLPNLGAFLRGEVSVPAQTNS